MLADEVLIYIKVVIALYLNSKTWEILSHARQGIS